MKRSIQFKIASILAMAFLLLSTPLAKAWEEPVYPQNTTKNFGILTWYLTGKGQVTKLYGIPDKGVLYSLIVRCDDGVFDFFGKGVSAGGVGHIDPTMRVLKMSFDGKPYERIGVTASSSGQHFTFLAPGIMANRMKRYKEVSYIVRDLNGKETTIKMDIRNISKYWPKFEKAGCKAALVS